MKEHTGKNKIFIVIIICLCAVIIAGLIYFMKLKGGSDSAFKPDLDSNAKTQTADDTGEKPTGIRIPGYPTITIEADKKDVQMNLMNPFRTTDSGAVNMCRKSNLCSHHPDGGKRDSQLSCGPGLPGDDSGRYKHAVQ